MPLRKRVGQEVSEIEKPPVLITRTLESEAPQLFDSLQVFGDDQLNLSTAVTPDAISPLSRYVEPGLIQFHQIVLSSALGTLPSQSGLPLNTVILPDHLRARVQVSENILFGIVGDSLFPSERESVEVELLFPVCTIDPFAPRKNLALNPPSLVTLPFSQLAYVRVLGMNYRDRIWRDVTPKYVQSKLIEEKSERKSKRKIHTPSDEEMECQSARPENSRSNFWDDIFLLLQPPIDLGNTASSSLPFPLYSYQPQGVHFLTQNGGALLADEMGTGKTVMTTVALKLLYRESKTKRTLILCPVSVLREWERHLSEWAPELWITFVRGTQHERERLWKVRSHVYVTTYSTFRNDLQRSVLPDQGVNSFDTVILDEAQYIKNPTSGRSKAVKTLNARYRWALSGTPMENKLEDLVSIFDFLHPDYLQPEDLTPNLIKKKIAPYFLRRRKADILPDLPPKQRQDFWTSLNREQRKEYDQVESEIRSKFGALGERVTKIHVFSAIMQLKKICNFATGCSTSPKVKLLKEHIEEIVENEQKVIVFTQFIGEGLLKLEKSLEMYGVAKIMGGQSDRERTVQVDRFKRTSSHEVPILLASVKAAGVGLNLKEATYVIHFDHWWNPAVMWQAEDRTHRANQTRGVNVYSYWIEDTIEERIFTILRQKKLLFQSVVDSMSEDQIEKQIDIQEWIDVVIGDQNVGTIRAGTKFEGRHTPSTTEMSLQETQRALLELSPKDFEHLTADLFRHLGYPTVRVTGKSADGGVDVIASRITSFGSEKVAVQCKRYKDKVGVKIARELLGVITSDETINRGFLVTSGKLTPACRRFCDSQENIETISGVQLAKYVVQYGLL